MHILIVELYVALVEAGCMTLADIPDEYRIEVDAIIKPVF